MPMTNNLGSDMLPDSELMGSLDLGGLDANFSWEMIGLGLEEPMPLQEASDELYGTMQPYLNLSNLAQDRHLLRQNTSIPTDASQIPLSFLSKSTSRQTTPYMLTLYYVVTRSGHYRQIHASSRHFL